MQKKKESSHYFLCAFLWYKLSGEICSYECFKGKISIFYYIIKGKMSVFLHYMLIALKS